MNFFCKRKRQKAAREGGFLSQFMKFLQGRESWIYDSRSTRTFTS